ncbi:hypothetical protein D3C85_1013890 [compost metagenome]
MIGHLGRQSAVGEGRNQTTRGQVFGHEGIGRQGHALTVGGGFDGQSRLVETRASRGVDLIHAPRLQPGRPVGPRLFQFASAQVDEDMLRQIGRAFQRLSSRQQGRTADRGHIGRQQPLGPHACIVAATIADGHIHSAAADIGQPHVRRHPDLDLRVRRREAGDARGQPFRGEGRRDADRQGMAAVRAIQQVPCPLQIVEAVVQQRIELGPQIGQGDLASLAVEQGGARVFLQNADLLADGAGRDRQLLGGAGDVQAARGGFESLQRVQRRDAAFDGRVLLRTAHRFSHSGVGRPRAVRKAGS